MTELLYLYGMIQSKEVEDAPLPSFKGFDNEHEGKSIQIGEITAVVSRLDPNSYSEDQIKQKVNQMEWLHEKAFHHHEILMMLNKNYTLIPTKFCTIYSSLDSLQQTIKSKKSKIIELLQSLKGKQEWNMKIYCDDNQLRDSFRKNNPKIAAKREEISELPPGRQYFEKRKLNQLIDRELEMEKNRICEQIHEELKAFCIDSSIKKTWDKDVLGRKEQMCWNSVYLLTADHLQSFMDKVRKTSHSIIDAGWKMEPTGPWPAYHFASLIDNEG
ncbi:GvpL/GvpF family gas vesicle protein [Metabacillus arenae]|uniref:GvpL/GvpF family gas vesicle protein n=1 Tax=Metabacillus arenae TaxID=2771434 RepID=A0A926NER0_9BACI|nr:GvpL/GvpF family gas vesicle protein [Metabacillus arenae]MBD1380169.1 GvpL/GvpF family gas vesicle protein [Metabacillus arenae]